jgi:hypothetical protein
MTHLMRYACVIGLLATGTLPVPAWAEQQALGSSLEPAEAQSAQDVLGLLLAAYAAGNMPEAENWIEPRMIGYSRVAEGIRNIGLTHKQLRVELSDLHTQVADDVVIIQARWDKRYILFPALTPMLRSGVCTFVLHREATVWRLSAMSGDNPFGRD